MDPILVVLGIAGLVIVYQIYSGEIMSSMKYGVHKTNRKTEPVKFWLNMLVQVLGRHWCSFSWVCSRSERNCVNTATGVSCG